MPVVRATQTMPQGQENAGANNLHSFSRDKGRRDEDDTPPAPVLAPEPVMAVQTPAVPETSTPAAESEATEKAEAEAAAKAVAAEEAAGVVEELNAASTAWASQPITTDAAEIAPLCSRLRSAIAAAVACGVAVDKVKSLTLAMDENEKTRAEFKANVEKLEVEMARREREHKATTEAAEARVEAAEKAAEKEVARKVALEELRAAHTAWSRQPLSVDAAEMAPHSSRLRGAIAAAIACGVAADMMESLTLSMDENEEMRAEYKAVTEARAARAAAAAPTPAAAPEPAPEPAPAAAPEPAAAPAPGPLEPEASEDEVTFMGELTRYQLDQELRKKADRQTDRQTIW